MTSKAPVRAVQSSRSRSESLPLTTALSQVLRRCPHFRGKTRLQSWLAPSAGTVRANIFGYEMDLDLSDVIQRDICAGLYEPDEAHAIQELLRPGMTVLDVGANVGFY